jgi:predicted Zn-dependent peptidase
MALPGIAVTDPTIYSLEAFTNILGGGMSSRLFQEARERRGLCYTISSFHMPYSDIGIFYLYAGTDAADTAELMRVIVGEIAGAAETISEPEVARAKAQMKASLLMALESSGARINQLARQMITHGRPLAVEELVEKVDAVTVESARAAGRALIARGKMATAVIGLGSGLESAAAIAETLTRRAA